MHKGKGLLVCDDIRDFLNYFGKLKAVGYEVVLCDTYDEGARRLVMEDFDFVVVNQGGADFEGKSILELAMNLPRPIPVLVVARSVIIHNYLEAMELGAVDYLERPEFEDLRWTLETQIRRIQPVLGPDIAPNLRRHMKLLYATLPGCFLII
jgi:DNA-binding response OmpR family regulator